MSATGENPNNSLILILKAVGAQASNAAYFLEHAADPEMLEALNKAGKTVAQRYADCLANYEMFAEMLRENSGAVGL